MTDEIHVDQLAELVRQTARQIREAQAAGVEPDQPLLDACRRLEKAVADYKAAAPKDAA